jgi:hypothetical protein
MKLRRLYTIFRIIGVDGIKKLHEAQTTISKNWKGKQAREQFGKVVDAEKVIARTWRAREEKKNEDKSWQSVARELFFKNAGSKGHFVEPDWVRFLKLFSLEHPDLSLHFKKRCGRGGTMSHQDFAKSLPLVAKTHGFDHAEHLVAEIHRLHEEEGSTIDNLRKHQGKLNHKASFQKERKHVDKQQRAKTCGAAPRSTVEEILFPEPRPELRPRTKARASTKPRNQDSVSQRIEYIDYCASAFQQERDILEQAHAEGKSFQEILSDDPLAARSLFARAKSAAMLLECGVSLADVLARGYSAGELGLTVNDYELHTAGFSGADLFKAHFARKQFSKTRAEEVAQLWAEGATAEETRKIGYSAAELREGGYQWEEVLVAGFSEDELKAADVSGRVHDGPSLVLIQDSWFESFSALIDETMEERRASSEEIIGLTGTAAAAG